MRKYKAIIAFAMFLAAAACGNAAKPVAQSNNSAPSTPDRSQTAIAHSSENKAAPYATSPSGNAPSRPGATGDPIDTKDLDAAIMTAEKALAGKPADETAKKALAGAFYKRAVALTEARQYASALGDYRRTLKYDASNADAKNWIDQITMIYGSLNRPVPKEGEEPAPMPFTKSS